MVLDVLIESRVLETYHIPPLTMLAARLLFHYTIQGSLASSTPLDYDNHV